MNIGWALTRIARERPDAVAVVEPAGRNRNGQRKYRRITFQDLDRKSSNIAGGLKDFGIQPGMRLALLVRPGIDFVTLVFSLFKCDAVTILIDPGMGRQHLVNCLEAANPSGFVAIPLAHAIRVLKRKRFPNAKFNVTLGRRWFWGGETVRRLEKSQPIERPLETGPATPAAIIFTTGSTGPPKGVLYQHGNFAKQVSEIQQRYGIQAGEIDLAGFPLFGLFNSAMGVTTVFPDMDFTRPADVNPKHLLEHAKDWEPTQSFGSPALWNTVATYCEKTGDHFATIRRVLSAGAPVPPHVLRRLAKSLPDDAVFHTPYGATEALPVATISSEEILTETASRSNSGAGTCVGTKFPGIEWKVISISDKPILAIDQVTALPHGEIGELIVKGDVVTSEYVTRTDANQLAKITDGRSFWHRMGDCGYLDDRERFWFCGRKSHRIETKAGTMFTVPCEAIASRHKRVFRSALVGIGNAGDQTPAMIVELWPDAMVGSDKQKELLLDEVHQILQTFELTRSIKRDCVLLHHSFPVDIRHNAKIFREQLAPWAAKQIRSTSM